MVKTLEELGIGRPSTYAPTISTIIARRYVAKEGRNLYLTELGEVVNQYYEDRHSQVLWSLISRPMWSLCLIKWKRV